MITVKDINRLNRRLRDTEKKLKDTYLLDRMINNAKDIEGITWSSDRRLSTSKKALSKITDKAFEALSNIIKTPKEMIKEARNYIKDIADNEGVEVDVDNQSDEEVIAMAGAILKIYDKYEEALKDFYLLREIDTSSITNDDIRAEIESAIINIGKAIRHPGTWALPISVVEENKKNIGELHGKIEAVVMGG